MHTKTIVKRKFLPLALFALLLLPGRSFGAPSIADSAIYFVNGHTYYLLQSSTWSEAEAAAVLLGGHLATVNDAAENTWIFNQWGATRSLWIGFNDVAVEGNFVWASGAPVSYTNWRAGEPNNGVLIGANEDWTYILAAGQSESPGQWNDFENLSTVPGQPAAYGVVEVVPEPSLMVLGACGVVGWLLKRRRQ